MIKTMTVTQPSKKTPLTLDELCAVAGGRYISYGALGGNRATAPSRRGSGGGSRACTPGTRCARG
jgi:hypothetical protein